MSLFRLLAYAALHLAPRKFLETELARRLSAPGYRFSPRFSGRVALLELARALRGKGAGAVALAPDYVCNIVPRALTEAGWTVEAYPLDDRLETDWTRLQDRLRRGDVGLLLGASVFGSSGLLDLLNDESVLRELRALGVFVVADLAQDVRLTARLPAGGADVVSAIVSFNDKSFPGAMGGGILSREAPAPAPRAMGFRLQYLLYRRVVLTAVKEAARLFRGRGHPGVGFDYSECASFPFRFTDVWRPAKIQLICAAYGMMRLKHYTASKRRLFEQGHHVSTRHAATAAYLIMEPEADDQGRLEKRPYAIEGRPAESLRARDRIVHNKGFDDCA